MRDRLTLVRKCESGSRADDRHSVSSGGLGSGAVLESAPWQHDYSDDLAAGSPGVGDTMEQFDVGFGSVDTSPIWGAQAARSSGRDLFLHHARTLRKCGRHAT